MYEAGIYGLIHHAAGVDESKCLRMLLNIGISANEVSNEIDLATPLHFAALNNCLTNVDRLLEKGAKVTVSDSAGNTAMHFAVMNGSLELIMLLDAKGADASYANRDGITPIMMAFENQQISIYFKSQEKYKNLYSV